MWTNRIREKIKRIRLIYAEFGYRINAKFWFGVKFERITVSLKNLLVFNVSMKKMSRKKKGGIFANSKQDLILMHKANWAQSS